MGKLKISDFVLYRWRYQLGFVTIGILLVAILFGVTFLSPGGVSSSEMDSVVTSTFTKPTTLLGKSPEQIIHLPYRLFQKLSLAALDVTVLSIKLPSLILAIGSVLALYGLLRLWFRRNVAIISAFIVVVTGQFLLLSQLGTPAIGYIFWNAAMLYSASMLARTEKYRWFWFILASGFAALSLYSPLQIYAVLALIATCLIHPHARFIVFKQLPKWVLGLSGVLALIAIMPLVLSLVQKPSMIIDLLGFPRDLSVISLATIKTQLLQYAGFYNATSDVRITPAYGLGIVALVFVGLYRLFTAKYTAKSYIITIWFCLLLPAVLINPDAAMVTFVPVVLLVAHGINYLIASWYKLFPANPYARVFGLLPLAVLVFGLVVSGVERFMYGYHYDPASSSVFNDDLRLVNKTIDKHKGKRIALIVPESQQKFYTIYSERKAHTPRVVVSNDVPKESFDMIIVQHDSKVKPAPTANEIIVSAVSKNADRFYLYKKP